MQQSDVFQILNQVSQKDYKSVGDFMLKIWP